MSYSRTVTLHCDICREELTWKSKGAPAASLTVTRAAAKALGWRVDKLNRDVCSYHPTLKRQKTGTPSR